MENEENEDLKYVELKFLKRFLNYIDDNYIKELREGAFTEDIINNPKNFETIREFLDYKIIQFQNWITPKYDKELKTASFDVFETVDEAINVSVTLEDTILSIDSLYEIFLIEQPLNKLLTMYKTMIININRLFKLVLEREYFAKKSFEYEVERMFHNSSKPEKKKENVSEKVK